MTTTQQTTQCKGFITEEHSNDVREVFGAEVADRLNNCKDGETFLSILFQLDNSKKV